MKRIDTMSIRDILRHHHDLGLPRAEIAVAVSVSAGTVSNVLERAQAAGLSWPLPSDLDDDGLRAQLYPPAPRESEYAQPDWDDVLRELRAKRKRRRVRATRRTLWEEYRDETKARGGKAYSYSQFCARLKAHQGSCGGSAQMHFDYEPGLYGMADFSGKTLALRSGRGETDVEIFVAVLAHSNLIYAEAVPDQTVRHWTMAHRRALEYFEQPNIDRLLQLGLSGMAEALEEQRDIADVDQLGFDDRLALMIEREAEHRDHKSYLGHLRQAQLRIRADVQDVDCRAGRGIARTTLTQLAAGDWIRQGHNLILGGPTGSGKTFVACALAHQACRQHQSVLYRRVPELVAAFTRARDKGTLERLMGRLGRVSLLVLDDWGLQGFSTEGRRDLLEIVEARHGRKSILVASQIPVERWPEVIGEPTIADAVLDRIVHNAYRIELKGESQRKRNKPPPLDGGGNGNRAPA